MRPEGSAGAPRSTTHPRSNEAGLRRGESSAVLGGHRRHPACLILRGDRGEHLGRKDTTSSRSTTECKFWGGPQVLTKTIDQLLGYTSWRDTETAVLLFNRERALSTVLEKIAPTVAQHDNFIREVPFGDDTSFRFVLSHRDDARRHFTLTVMVFELPG